MRVKLETLFTAHDINLDGVWTLDDIAIYEARMITLNRLDEKKTAELLAGFNKWWIKRLDFSPTRTFTKEQFVQKMIEIYNADSEDFQEIYESLVETMIELMDVNHDDYLSKDEFNNAMRALGVNPLPHMDNILIREGDGNGISVDKLNDVFDEFLGKSGPNDDDIVDGINKDGVP